MDTFNNGNMLNLYRQKACLVALILWVSTVYGQTASTVALQEKNTDEKTYNGVLYKKPYDFKKGKIGFIFGLNVADYAVIRRADGIDTFNAIYVKAGPGIHFGLVCTYKLHNLLDIRALPSFALQQRTIRFEQRATRDTAFNRTSESAIFQLPLEIKFKSERNDDFRVYLIGGTLFSYDMSNRASDKVNRDKLIRTQPFDIAGVVGFGMDFYREKIKLSPEIKFAHGINNILIRETNNSFSNGLDSLRTQTLMLNLIIDW
ncbi:MAG: PorT family protein [Bacteroidia bacterium]|nr:PorT family protein [Bacteroidia bacterium]MDW8301073.1 porin family protein [Bacteroidia bacterium]